MIFSVQIKLLTPMLIERYRRYIQGYTQPDSRSKVEFNRVIRDNLNRVKGASVSAGGAPEIASFSVPRSKVRSAFIKRFSSLSEVADVETQLSNSRRQIKQIIVGEPDLLDDFFNNSASTDIAVIADGLVKYYNLSFSRSSFLSRDFNITWDPATNTFNTKLVPSKEAEIRNLIENAGTEYNAKTIREFEAGLNNLKRRGIANFAELTVDVSYLSNKGIPTSSATLYTDSKDFIVGRFISAIDLTILIRRKIQANMRPQSFTSPPRPPRMTTRTLQFRNSFEIRSLDYRRSVMNYFYLPYYDENERYGYEVSGLVQRSIRSVLQERLGRQLNLVRQFNN